MNKLEITIDTEPIIPDTVQTVWKKIKGLLDKNPKIQPAKPRHTWWSSYSTVTISFNLAGVDMQTLAAVANFINEVPKILGIRKMSATVDEKEVTIFALGTLFANSLRK